MNTPIEELLGIAISTWGCVILLVTVDRAILLMIFGYLIVHCSETRPRRK